jgi:hypothetical protein
MVDECQMQVMRKASAAADSGVWKLNTKGGCKTLDRDSIEERRRHAEKLQV